jgi:bifunctional DNA-binding transcriptional regulator/antitoxin component of YhaV-PrlF toxin-antitoxin module
MIKLTVVELEKTIDSIIDDYSNGDDTIYLINHGKGDVVLKPYDGPYTTNIKKNYDETYFELPKRLLSKLGWKEGDSINIECKDNSLYLTKNII